MAPDFLSILLEELSTTHYAFLAAVVLGFLGVLVVLCITLRGGSSKPEKEEEEETTEKQQQETANQNQKQQQPKLKGIKPKPTRKITLPSHPLLAAEFKGHTGTVFSLDFDHNGKYLASCSEGRNFLIWRKIEFDIKFSLCFF